MEFGSLNIVFLSKYAIKSHLCLCLAVDSDIVIVKEFPGKVGNTVLS